jgi:hypothetical protein
MLLMLKTESIKWFWKLSRSAESKIDEFKASSGDLLNNWVAAFKKKQASLVPEHDLSAASSNPAIAVASSLV